MGQSLSNPQSKINTRAWTRVEKTFAHTDSEARHETPHTNTEPLILSRYRAQIRRGAGVKLPPRLSTLRTHTRTTCTACLPGTHSGPAWDAGSAATGHSTQAMSSITPVIIAVSTCKHNHAKRDNSRGLMGSTQPHLDNQRQASNIVRLSVTDLIQHHAPHRHAASHGAALHSPHPTRLVDTRHEDGCSAQCPGGRRDDTMAAPARRCGGGCRMCKGVCRCHSSTVVLRVMSWTRGTNTPQPCNRTECVGRHQVVKL